MRTVRLSQRGEYIGRLILTEDAERFFSGPNGGWRGDYRGVILKNPCGLARPIAPPELWHPISGDVIQYVLSPAYLREDGRDSFELYGVTPEELDFMTDFVFLPSVGYLRGTE